MTARVADVVLEREFVPSGWAEAAMDEAGAGFEVVWMVDPDPGPDGVVPGLVSASIVNTVTSTYAEVAVVKVDPADASTWTMAELTPWLPCPSDDEDEPMTVCRPELLPAILDAGPDDWEAVLLADGLGEPLTPEVRAAAQELLEALRAGDGEDGQLGYLRTLVLASDAEFAGLAAAARRATEARGGS